MQDQRSAAERQSSEVRVPSPQEHRLTDSDSKASEEANRLAQDEDLDRAKAQGDHKRSEALRNHFSNVCIGLIYLATLLGGVMAIVYVLHLILPADLRFLSEQQLGEIKSMVFSGVVGAFVGQYFKRVI